VARQVRLAAGEWLRFRGLVEVEVVEGEGRSRPTVYGDPDPWRLVAVLGPVTFDVRAEDGGEAVECTSTPTP
jgi:hypothetical protein